MGNESVGQINQVMSTWKGADGDGEGLVPNESRISHTVEMCIKYEENGRHEESS